MDCRMPGFLIHHQLLKLTQTHVYHFGNAIQTSDTLSVPSLLAFNFSQHEGLFYESGLSIKWPKYWSFSFTICPSNEYSGLIYFLDRLVGSPCCPSSKASILLHSAFFIFQFSHSYMTTGKTIALTRRTFVGKVVSLLFNMMSKLCLSYDGHNFSSKGQASFNFMAAVTNCSDFRAQKDKV